jgi:septal ring factor EnvC (AmiA/AmiB activator)
VRHDPTKEIAAAVREATAPLMAAHAEELMAFADREDEAWRLRDYYLQSNVKLTAAIMEQRAEIERLNEAVEAYNACVRKDAATIMELRAKVTQLDADYLWISDRLNPMEQERDELRNTLGHVVGARDRAEAECIELRDHLSQANASLAEMTRCRTAGQLQEAKEREVYPFQDAVVPSPFGPGVALPDAEDRRRRTVAGQIKMNDPREACSGSAQGGLLDGLQSWNGPLTAADLQHARERTPRRKIADAELAEFQGTTYPWHVDHDDDGPVRQPDGHVYEQGPGIAWKCAICGCGPNHANHRPTYQRTDDDGPMWRPEDVAT